MHTDIYRYACNVFELFLLFSQGNKKVCILIKR